MALEQPNLRIEFDPSQLHGALARKELIRGEAVLVEAYSGDVKKTMPARMKLGAETLAILLMRSGTALIWGETDKRWFVLPPSSVTYVRGPVNFSMSFARMDQRMETIGWHMRSTPVLSDWLEKVRSNSARPDRPRVFATMPYRPFFQTVVERFDEICAGNAELAEPHLISVIYEMVPRLVRSRSRVGLAPIPADLPPNIAQLVQQVRQRPDIAWPLKDAADLVGYSPFHFSRVYKQLIGYGFHEFVDRCRTEHAVDMLCTSDTPIDVVAAASGYGTTQALRESVKEYLGLVPSELRGIPEEFQVTR